MAILNTKQGILARVYLCFFFVLAYAVLVMVYAFRIQFIEGHHWKAMADSLMISEVEIEATRGNIYACDGSLLATSVPVYTIYMDTRAEGISPEAFKQGVDSLALMLSLEFKDKSKNEYHQLLSRARRMKDRYCLLQRRITYEQLKHVKDFPIFRLGRNRGGLIIEEIDIRDWPFGELALKTIGKYRPEKDSAIYGLEAAYNKELSGHKGKRLMQKIMGGNWMPLSNENDIEPQDGYDLVTTLDITMQDDAEHALMKGLIENDAESGTIIVMETKTGDVKALASLKKTAPGVYKENASKNLGMGVTCDPGSTFKLASVLCLLEDGKVGPNDRVNSEDGTTQYPGGAIMRDSEHGGHGMISLEESFEMSSNVGISKFIWQHYKNNPAQYTNRIRNKFRFGSKLNVGFLGEPDPEIHHPGDGKWSATSLPWMSIGYEVLITPLQTLTFYNAIANGGVMVKPRFITRMENTGKVVQEFPVVVLDSALVSKNSLQRVMPMLLGVVESNWGTAKKLASPNYRIAGKTGTARTLQNGKYDGPYRSSFCGFFPADNPQYTIYVMVYYPNKGIYYGAQVAGPIFREVSDKIFARCAIRPNTPYTADSIFLANRFTQGKGYAYDFEAISRTLGLKWSSQLPSGLWGKWHVDGVETKVEDVPNEGNKVPDTRSMSARDALYLLENKGLKVVLHGSGKVIRQSIKPDSPLKPGTSIVLTLG